MIEASDVEAAARRIQGAINRTPVLGCRALDQRVGCRSFIKPECLQRTGSFKIRGAFNKVSSLEAEQLAAGMLAYSSGNHGAGVAVAAASAGSRAVILMPSDASPFKLERTRGYGAEVILFDRLVDNREAIGADLMSRRGLMLVHPFEDPLVAAGQGTAVLELLEDAGELDVVLVPIGGGGLAAGSACIARATYPELRVVGVEPVDGDDTRRSLEAGQPVEIAPPATIADALRATRPGAATFALNKQLLDSVVTVTDREIAEAMAFLFEWVKIVVEPSGAATVAALLARKVTVNDLRVGVVVSGGNIDQESFVRLASGST